MSEHDSDPIRSRPAFFHPADPQNALVVTARVAFLTAVGRRTPEVMRDLRDNVLPVYIESNFTDLSAALFEGDLPPTEAQRAQETVLKVHELIRGWMSRYGFTESREEWILTQVAFGLWAWETIDWAKEHRVFPTLLMKGPKVRPLDFSMAGWDTRDEPWSTFKRKAEAEFRRRLLEYREKTEFVARDAGYREAQIGRARSHPDPDVHYEWLALRLCRRHKYEEIANDYCSLRGEQLTGQGVRQAVRRKADLIGLKVPSRT